VGSTSATLAPQVHLCTWPSSVPIGACHLQHVGPTASSVKRRPQAELGIADSQSPL